MAWNDMTREQMEAQLLRQAQTIGKMREALKLINMIDAALCNDRNKDRQKVEAAQQLIRDFRIQTQEQTQ